MLTRWISRGPDAIGHDPDPTLIFSPGARALFAPPARVHLGVERVIACAEREVLDAVGPRLDVAHRVLVEADRVPLAQLDDLVLDLDPCGTANDDVDLLLPFVLVTERNAEVRLERHQAEAEILAFELPAAEASLHLVGHVELRRCVLDVFPQIFLRVSAHVLDSRRDSTVGSSGRRDGVTSRQVHWAGSLSSRKRISFVPC